MRPRFLYARMAHVGKGAERKESVGEGAYR